jgi:hypothetical protein
MARHILILSVALASTFWAATSHAGESPSWKWYEVKNGQVEISLHVFWSTTCPHCAKAHVFLDGLRKRRAWLKVSSYEVSRQPENMALYRQMAVSLGRQAGQVPAFFFCKRLEIGFVSDETSGRNLEESLASCHAALQKQLDERRTPPKRPLAVMPVLLAPPLSDESEAEPEIELELPAPPSESRTVDVPGWGSVQADEVSLPTLTVVLGGLDSFNPCAFFVLLILLGLMMHTGSRGKMLLVGGVFVTVSGLVYFLFMAAWLNLFFLIGHLRVITLIAGCVALTAAAINIKDYFWFKQGVTLSLTDTARSRLVRRMLALSSRAGFVPAVAGTAALAFVANLYELLCTSGFPLVYTRVLTLRELSPTAYYGYLALYNVVYATPLFLIVVGFSLTLSSHKLTEYQGRALKLVSGLMMLALGAILVIDPDFLNNLVGAGVTLAVAVAGAATIIQIHRAVGKKRGTSPSGGPAAPSANQAAIANHVR